ncbi:3515_t:CDS:2, partial [Cetraspora pellucida]
MDALADASIVHIMIEDFFKTLKTMKGQTIENFKQIIDISGYVIPIYPKEIASHISDNIFMAINFKFKFYCKGWLMLTVDIEKLQVTTELTHEYHAEYVDLAIKIIEQYDDIEILLTVEDNRVTIISFGVIDIINQLRVNVVKIGIDVTYNTNKMNLELYSVLAEVDGMRFLLAYILLTTATAIINDVRTKMITYFLNKLYHVRIKPTFVITDKDTAQILAIKAILPDAYIQLSNAEFAFIDIDFCLNIASDNIKRYRSPSFWKHKDLILLIQGLEPVEEDETYELEEEIDIDISVENEKSNEADEDLVEQLNNKTDDELVDTLEEYEDENDDFFEKVDESWEEVNNRVTQELQQ